MFAATVKFCQTKTYKTRNRSSIGNKAYLTNIQRKVNTTQRYRAEKMDLCQIIDPKLDAKQSARTGFWLDCYSLPYITATLFACLLEDALIQMRILGECNNGLRIMKTMSEMGILLALKHQVKQVDDSGLDEINSKDLESSQYKLDKLFADRKFFTDVLAKTYLDISLNRCFNSLKDSNNKIDGIYAYRIRIEEEEAKNRINRREMMRQLRQHRNHIKSVVYDTNVIIDQLRSQVEDTDLYSRIRSRYTDNWQLARTEQHNQSIFDKESGSSTLISYYRNKSEQEQRVHSEVELLVNIAINEVLTKVEHWMGKYDVDLEAQELKLAIMKNKYRNAQQRRIELEETYATHEVLMKNWLQFKKERQERIEYVELMNKSAHIVQAWWRGLLVRLELGPYKPKKKRTKPEAGKKKQK